MRKRTCLNKRNHSRRYKNMKIGFDNDKYLSMQSEHIKSGSDNSVTNCIWSSAANFLTITMPPESFPDLHQIVSCVCCFS